MIKRIIFDLDNTLIMWKDEYEKAADEALVEINYPKTENLYHRINEIESDYEVGKKKFDRNEVIDYINQKLDINLPYNFLNIWLEKLESRVPDVYSKKDYETLEYLSKKYELVILTNWFLESQIKRLENVGILKFFSYFYGAEKHAKPFKESFIEAAGPYKMNQVAMVGDNFNLDIKGALNTGIEKVIWRDVKNKKEEYKNELDGICVIQELDELKKIF